MSIKLWTFNHLRQHTAPSPSQDCHSMPVNSLDPVAQAAQALERGDLAMAERLALGVLEREENADALHLLSLARLKQNRVDEALDLIRRSLAVRPGHAGALLHLGKA